MSTVTLKIVYDTETVTHVVKVEDGKVFFNGKHILADFNKQISPMKEECQDIYDDHIELGYSPEYASVKAGLYLPTFLDDNNVVIEDEEDEYVDEEASPFFLELRDLAVLHLLGLLKDVQHDKNNYEIVVNYDQFHENIDCEELYLTLVNK